MSISIGHPSIQARIIGGAETKPSKNSRMNSIFLYIEIWMI